MKFTFDINTATSEQLAFIVKVTRRAQAEILHDMKFGVVPVILEEFGELHDHVDANEYGGMCEDAIVDEGNLLFPERTDDTIATQGLMDVFEDIQTYLDLWITSKSYLGRVKTDLGLTIY